jgi:MSHA biogenesis protein MshO
MARDIRLALPNSVRLCPGGTNGLMFIPTKTGGRYRAELDATGAGDVLDFTAADSSFNMLGSNDALPAGQRIALEDVIAVYNLGIPGADAYNQENTSRVSAPPVVKGAETQISIDSTKFFLASGSNRFHVIPAAEKVVAYVCSGGQLARYASGALANACPTTGSVLADKVSCSFVYNGSDSQRNALVQVTLKFTDSGETVGLYQEVHVDNTP